MDWFIYGRDLRHERVKPTCFYWFEKQEGNDRLLKSTLAILDKYWRSGNLFYCKTYARGVLRTRSNIYNKAFLWFSQRSSTIDVRLGSKYASANIYIQVSLRNYMHIEYFCCKIHFFWQKKNESELAVSSKRIKENFRSLYLILAYLCSCCMIHSEWRFEGQT